LAYFASPVIISIRQANMIEAMAAQVRSSFVRWGSS
jgi:hypothetical protein